MQEALLSFIFLSSAETNESGSNCDKKDGHDSDEKFKVRHPSCRRPVGNN